MLAAVVPFFRAKRVGIIQILIVTPD